MKRVEKVKMPRKKVFIADEMIADLRGLCEMIGAGKPIEEHFKVRTVRLNLPSKTYGPDDVKAVRKKLNASQGLLARFLGVSLATVCSWEQGKRTIPAMAGRYLDDISRFPVLWTSRLVVEQTSPGARAAIDDESPPL